MSDKLYHGGMREIHEHRNTLSAIDEVYAEAEEVLTHTHTKIEHGLAKIKDRRRKTQCEISGIDATIAYAEQSIENQTAEH